MKRWTLADDTQLRALHATHTQAQLAEILGRTLPAVRTRCCDLGLNEKGSRWTDAQIRRLIEVYGASDGKAIRLDDLAEELGKLKSNVSRKARTLGLTNQQRPKTDEPKITGPKYSSDAERNAAISEVRKAWIREHGHPRGALGLRHSDESKKKMSDRNRAAWADPESAHNSDASRQRRSDAMYERMADGKMLAGREAYSRTASGKREDLNDRYFRSSWEANYARFLNLIQDQGEIASWDYECKTFVFEKIRRGTRSYTPDFLVNYPDGRHEWHEVKGWMDQPSRTRIERFGRYYPDEVLKVIDADWFKAAKKTGLAGVIPNWETGRRRGG